MKVKTALALLALLPLLALPSGGAAAVPPGPSAVFEFVGALSDGTCTVQDVRLLYTLENRILGWSGALALEKGPHRAEGRHHQHSGVVTGSWSDGCVEMAPWMPWESRLWSVYCPDEGPAEVELRLFTLSDVGHDRPLVFTGTGTYP